MKIPDIIRSKYQDGIETVKEDPKEHEISMSKDNDHRMCKLL